MYVCLCNGFTCRDVRKAIGEGAATVGGVFRACDARPNCGRCKEAIQDELAEAKPATPAVPLLFQPSLIAAE